MLMWRHKILIPLMPSQFERISNGQLAPVASTIYKPLIRSPIKRKWDAEEPKNPYRVSRANKPVKCGRCQKEWHNARGCKANVTGESPWERRKRVQKGNLHPTPHADKDPRPNLYPKPHPHLSL